MQEDTASTKQEAGSAAVAPSSDLTVSPAFDVLVPRLRPQRLAESGPSIAYGDGLYFVVWEDTRVGGVFGARMEPDGTLLDPSGIQVNTVPGRSDGTPSVAFDGTDFVVVWRDASEGIFGTRVSPGGTVVGPDFTVASSDEIGGGPPGIACSPAVCLVSFESVGDFGDAITARRVLPDGTVLRLSALLTPELPGIMGDATVAWNGERFLVVWADARGGGSTPDIWGSRVLPDGTVLDPGGFPIASAPGVQRNPAVTWTGTRFLVVWDDTRGGGEPDIFAARVRPSGEVSEPGGIPISTASGAQRFPRVAPYGGKSLIVWEDRRSGRSRVWGARITEAGELVDTAGIPISEGEDVEERLPFVAAGGERYLVAWAGAGEDPALTSMYIRGKRVSRSGGVQDDASRYFTRAADRQEAPAAAAADDMYLVAWIETRAFDVPAVFAARMLPDGRVLDSRGIRMPNGAFPRDVQVASDGRDFLLVWTEENLFVPSLRADIRGARVSRSGDLLDATGIPITDMEGEQQRPAVAFLGGVYLVAWDSEDVITSGPPGVYVSRVSRAGEVLEPGGRRLSSETFDASSPAVSYVGDTFLVAWLGGGSAVRGARMTPGGTLLEPGGFPILGAGPVDSPPSLSTDGDRALVVWEQWQGPDTNLSDVYGTRVSAGATVLDTPFLIASGPASEGNPRTSFDGSVHVVVWERADVPLGPRAFPDVYATRVTPEAGVLDPAGIPLATTPDVADRNPAVASVGDGRSVVLYDTWVGAPSVRQTRVRARLLDSD